MKKIAIIGHFGADGLVADGQTVKTNILTQELEQVFSTDQVTRISTFGWKKRAIRLFSEAVKATLECDDVILMTDAGGIKVFPWLLLLANFRKKSKLHYVVVGGWLVHTLKKHRFLSACLKRFNSIFVETNAMKNGLESLGFTNLYIMRNCKRLSPLTDEEMPRLFDEPYKLCLFSRIMKEKGVEEAIDSVAVVNEYFGRAVFSLDIYGQVDDKQIAWFEKLSTGFPEGVKYCGVAPFDKSVEILKSYFALLFPTKFYTEGVPGTIIDSYAAGVPVISSEWENFADVIDNGTTGITYSFERPQLLCQILIDIADEPSKILQMKSNCLKKVEEYLPDNALNVLWDVLFQNE